MLVKVDGDFLAGGEKPSVGPGLHIHGHRKAAGEDR
jgi:hypothetical protein